MFIEILKWAVILIMVSIAAIFIFTIFVLDESGKYDYIWTEDPTVPKESVYRWTLQPVHHACGEPIDEEFIKLWNERKNQHKKYVEEMRMRKGV